MQGFKMCGGDCSMYGKDFFVGVDLKVYVDIDVKLR